MTQNPGGGRLSAATLADLEKPEKLETLLKQERVGDCLSCRLVGGTAFIGLGAYSYFSGKNHLEKNQAAILKSGSRFGLQSRHTALAVTALALAGAGVFRWVN